VIFKCFFTSKRSKLTTYVIIDQKKGFFDSRWELSLVDSFKESFGYWIVKCKKKK